MGRITELKRNVSHSAVSAASLLFSVGVLPDAGSDPRRGFDERPLQMKSFFDFEILQNLLIIISIHEKRSLFTYCSSVNIIIIIIII